MRKLAGTHKDHLNVTDSGEPRGEVTGWCTICHYLHN